MGNIFISYRRGDSIATAGRIRDRLVQEFGRPRVFVDVDDIPHGRDFEQVLQSKIAECGVLLAIIGPHWLDASDETGKRRLDDKDDFVGIEISSALARKGIAVIPVLVDNARMPTAEELPEWLKPLARRNAIELRNTQFGSDSARLINSIKAATGTGSSRSVKVAAWAAVAAVLAGGAYMAWSQMHANTRSPQRVAGAPAGGAPVSAPQVIPATATTTVPVAPPSELGTALGRLRELMRPAEGRVQVGLRGGNRVRLGDQIVFEVASKVPGRLILVDINAAGEVTQIFPNTFLTSEAMTSVAANIKTTVPGPGYGFSGFKAVEPAGKGRLVALVVPDGVSMAGLALVREQASKGFEPVNAPGAYLGQLIDQARNGADRARGAGLDAWAFAIADYEIVK